MLLRPFPLAGRPAAHLPAAGGRADPAGRLQAGRGTSRLPGLRREHRGRHGDDPRNQGARLLRHPVGCRPLPRAAGPRRPAPLRPAGHHDQARGHPAAHRPVVPGAGRLHQQLLHASRPDPGPGWRRLGAPAALHPAARGTQPAPLPADGPRRHAVSLLGRRDPPAVAAQPPDLPQMALGGAHPRSRPAPLCGARPADARHAPPDPRHPGQDRGLPADHRAGPQRLGRLRPLRRNLPRAGRHALPADSLPRTPAAAQPLHPPAAEDLRRGPRLVPAAGQRPRRRRTDARAALDPRPTAC